MVGYGDVMLKSTQRLEKTTNVEKWAIKATIYGFYTLCKTSIRDADKNSICGILSRAQFLQGLSCVRATYRVFLEYKEALVFPGKGRQRAL